MDPFIYFIESFKTLGNIFYHTWWFVLPVSLYHIFHILHLDYVYFKSANSYHRGLKWTFIEIIPPADIERGPKMMESIYNGISGVTSSIHTFKQYISGCYTQDRFAIELISEEGRIRFLMRIHKKHRNLFESLIYAQYPDAQITETEDYTQKHPAIIPNRDWDLWGTDFEFIHKNIIFPIKTYDKFEETISGEMIDPLASIVEVMGSLGPGQHAWLQWVIEPLQEKWNPTQKAMVDKLKGKEEAPKTGIFGHLADVLLNIPKGLFGAVEFKTAEKKEQQPLEFRLSPVEKDVLKAVEENIGRYMYKTKMRFVHISRRSVFNKSFVSAVVGGVKQFNDFNYNALRPNDVSKTYGKIFLTERTASLRKRKIYKRYKERGMDDAKIWLSSKELATLFHFPDISVKTPAVPRTASKLGAAPSNLPVK